MAGRPGPETMAEIVRPAPAGRLAFLDTHPGWIWTLEFLPLITVPAAHHNNAGCMSFVDGCVEKHKWLDPRTLVPENVRADGDFQDEWGAALTHNRDGQWIEERGATHAR